MTSHIDFSRKEALVFIILNGGIKLNTEWRYL